MPQDPQPPREIHTLPSGSIDFAHYDTKARDLRSAEIWRILRQLVKRKKNSCMAAERGLAPSN